MKQNQNDMKLNTASFIILYSSNNQKNILYLIITY